MLLKPNAPRPPWYLGPLIGIAALLPLWEAGAVAVGGSMTRANCSGLFAGGLCWLGLAVGRLVFGEASAHFGYVFVSGGLGAFVLYLAWVLHARSRASKGDDA